MNNADFGYDSRNNLDNCEFEPIYHEIGEISYIRKYYNSFDKDVSKYVNSTLIEKEIEQTYNNKLLEIKPDDPFRNSKVQYSKTEKKKKTEWKSIKITSRKRKKHTNKNRTVKNYETWLDEANRNNKINSIIDFDEMNCNSIKSIVVKKNTIVKATTRFIKGKMLMFTKVSL